MKRLLFLLPVIASLFAASNTNAGSCDGVFQAGQVCGNPQVTGAPPTAIQPWQLAATIGPPKFIRITKISGTPSSFTPDINATLLVVRLVGPGGGGTGNSAANQIPYFQYGGIGTPSAFGVLQQPVTISNGANAVVTTAPNGNAWDCNRPFYFTNNNDTLPSPLAFNTVYIVYCGDGGEGLGNNAATTTTFSISNTSFNSPLTCSVFAASCQTTITTTTSGSGTHILNMFEFAATGGGGGGGVGDGGLPGNALGCDVNGPAAILQSVGHLGGIGGNSYGNNIAPGTGGSGYYGGGGANAGQGTFFTGGGGSGAFPLATASGGGGGGGGGSCDIILRLTPGTSESFPILCGQHGVGGPLMSTTVTFTNASPTVMNAPATFGIGGGPVPVNFPPWGLIQIGAGISTGTITTAGTGGTDGTYTNVGLIGGNGTNNLATVTVSGHVVTNVVITTPGTNYYVNDVLGAVPSTIGNVTSFTWTVTAVNTPTGITGGTQYYTFPTDNSGQNFNLYNTPYGSLINTSSTGSGTLTVNSGTAGGQGSDGSCEIWQYYGPT